MVDRDEVHQQIRDYLGENPFGTPKFLALSDFAAQKISEASLQSVLAVSQGTGILDIQLCRLQCLMKEAVISETIRTRRDTVPGYGEAFQHAQYKIFPSLLSAEGFKPQSNQYWYLVDVAATNLFLGLLNKIRGV